MATCVKCGAKKGLMGVLTADLGADQYICPNCEAAARQAAGEARRRTEQTSRQAEQDRVDRIKQAASKVIVTTTPKVDGCHVVAYLGIESVEFVIGTGVFSEVSTSISDFFGARSGAFEKKLQAAKEHAMNALKFVAAEKGANAVIGVDLDYAEFSGNRIALIINGTLVKLAPSSGRPPGTIGPAKSG